MLRHSVKMLSHRVQILAHSVQIFDHFGHILAHYVQILDHCGPMVAHCTKMLARDLGEPLIGHRRDSRRDRRTRIAPRTSLIANRTVVFATCSFLSSIRAKDLLFSYLCRSSLYAGADIG